MSEKPSQEFKSFQNLPDLRKEGQEGNEEVDKQKKEKKEPISLGRMLLSQMGLLTNQLELKKDEEKMSPLGFFLFAIETGWKKIQINKRAILCVGDQQC